jgi:hypothetical protein
MNMKFIFLILSTLIALSALAQPVSLNNFIVKEHLLKNSKLAIIAVDSADKPLETVSGTFIFSINGFKQELKFHDGFAISPQQIGKSTFVYLKHQNESGTHSKLYYVIKKNEDLNPVKINWMTLLLIPLAIIAIGTIFRKFLIIAVVILVVLFFFNSSKGLGLPTFFETIVDGLRSAF